MNKLTSIMTKILFANRLNSANLHGKINGRTSYIMRSALEMKADEDKTLNEAISLGYNPNFETESQVNNKYHKGDPYSIKFDGFNVSVTNKRNSKTTKFNLYNMVKSMNTTDRIAFLKYIQTLPGEALEDLAIEMYQLNSSTGQNMQTDPNNPSFHAGGYYSSSTDSIVTSPDHLVHELGHAVDYQGIGSNNSTVLKNKKFLACFNEELKNFLADGNKQFNKDDKTTWAKGASNYCTTNPKEFFAEAYALSMTGKNKCQSVIEKYFPKTFAMAMQILNQDRHKIDAMRNDSALSQLTHSVDFQKC